MSTRIVFIAVVFAFCMTSAMHVGADPTKDVNALIVNTEETAVPVSVTADDTAGVPVQFNLAGAFQDGDGILGQAPINYPPMSVNVTDSGYGALFVEYISCQAAPPTGQTLYVGFVVIEERIADSNPVAFRAHTPVFEDTGGGISGTLPGDPDRHILASNELVDFCVGPGCKNFRSAYRWENKLQLEGRREITDDFARVDCIVKGRLEQPLN